MFQCLLGDVCGEDWFHEECILGIPYGSVDRAKTKKIASPVRTASTYPVGVNMFDQLESAHSADVKAPDVIKEEAEERQRQELGDNDDSDGEDTTLEGLPNEDEFISFVCWKCVDKNRKAFNELRRLKGAVVATVVRGGFENMEDRNNKLSSTFRKRRLEDSDDSRQGNSKKSKIENATALTSNPTGMTKQEIEEDSQYDEATDAEQYSLFLADGFHEIVQQNTQPELNRLTSKFPCLLEEEEIYEPPDDNDANSSLMDGGARALNQLPREQAIEGMHAYSMIRERLTKFLKPFAEQGRIVTKDDVNNFFAEVKQQRESH
jgi:E3 ubiquitin-protein ligase UBR7